MREVVVVEEGRWAGPCRRRDDCEDPDARYLGM